MKNIFAHFDISPQGKNCDGTLTLKDGVIIKELEGKKEKFNISDMEEAVQYTDVGCGRLGEKACRRKGNYEILFQKVSFLLSSAVVHREKV